MYKHILLFCLCATSAFMSSCWKADDDMCTEFSSLFQQSIISLKEQNPEVAMKQALDALELARNFSMEDSVAKVMNHIANIDIATARDEQAWENATEAETLSRDKRLTKELAKSLLTKALICSFADYSPANNRNDEAIPLLDEALSLSKTDEDISLQVEAYYIYSQIYVNKNRWNEVLDMSLFNLAEDNLVKGETLADSYGLHELKLKGMLFRIRLLKQAGRFRDAVDYCNGVLASAREDDYLTRYQIYDQLTSLYHQLGDFPGANDSHMNTLTFVRKYIDQKASEKLQEMETKYQTALKEETIRKNRYMIICLLLATLLLSCIVGLLGYHWDKSRKKNAELEHKSKTKDKLISALTEDFDIADMEKNKESLDTAIADYVDSVTAQKEKTAKELGLTKREIEIIRLMSMGKSASDMATNLFISLRTVNNHKYHIFSKMDVKSTSELIAKARKLRII